ncbi:MAG: Hsp20/alpha crystallin family protein [Planctomycetaceae bacterium]|nr:Hsp20/alpha crystallin family protein [Planctomycetaceae bacterium]
MRPQFGMLDDFRKEMDQMVSRFFSGAGEHPIGNWSPRVNVAEAEDAYDVTADLPGLKPEDVNVEVKNGDLLISGERHGEHEEHGKTWHRVERHSGSFRRMIRLGDDVSADKVSAEYKDGVLKVHVPKSESAKSRKVEVRG